ncbi:putative 5xTM membrane YitT family protein [Azomonas agilis]|uniref:Putative 5xTM membrane YitT family protein n=1 Tax=Azomonas agilis TaxID=116849 RepID=A0A562J284_9GAMM|nr:YitT family protein [Azomonas agilis]TWH77298.1 putative 5xTM membrane YitT family protein [Azomonas agilis]
MSNCEQPRCATVCLHQSKPQHSWLDDVQGELSGILVVVLGVSLLKAAGLITGQFAGLALLIALATGFSFGSVFFLINVPFFIFAFIRMGGRFTLKSLIAISSISLLTDLMPQFIQYQYLNGWVAAVLGGLCTGIGLLMLFRHGCSCGGVGVVALYIQERTGFRAGWVQLIFDLVLFSVAFTLLPTQAVLLSLLGALVFNLAISLNHRRDRYIASS